MKFSFSGLVLLLGVFIFGIVVRADKPIVEQSLLWEISGNKIKRPSYLFGTMHLISKEKFYFPEALEEYVKSCDQLVMEIGGISEQMTAANKLFLSEGTLFELFTEEQLDTLFHFLKNNLDINKETAKRQYSRVKPLVIMQLTTRLHFGKQPESYELTLERIAKENNLTIAGLETAEEQMAIFDKMALADQVEMVMASLRIIDEAKVQTAQLEAIYLAQHVDSLYAFIHNDPQTLMNYEDDLLTSRNEKWIPLIKKHLKKQATFIAVGAGHLGGEKGVIALLKAEGYTLTPVKF